MTLAAARPGTAALPSPTGIDHTHGPEPVGGTGPASRAVAEPERAPHSFHSSLRLTMLFSTSVSTASMVSSEATAKAAADWYSL